MLTPIRCCLTADTEFVRHAALHRDARLADARYHSHGPNALVPGDTVYLYECPLIARRTQMIAVSLPDLLVGQRDAEAVRHRFAARDAACEAGAPWWTKPLGTG